MLQVCFLDCGVVIIIEIIETDDFIAALEQVFTDVATDKTGTPVTRMLLDTFQILSEQANIHPITGQTIGDANVEISLRAGEISSQQRISPWNFSHSQHSGWVLDSCFFKASFSQATGVADSTGRAILSGSIAGMGQREIKSPVPSP